MFTTEFNLNLLSTMKQIIFPALKIFFIIIFCKFVSHLVSILINRIFSSSKGEREKTLSSLLRSVSRYTIYFVGIILVLRELGFDILPLLAGAGIFGLAVGFGTQTLVKDIVSGFFIVLENQFAVGDKVVIGGISGEVIEMALRFTKIKDGDKIHIIPNGSINQVTVLKNENRNSRPA